MDGPCKTDHGRLGAALIVAVGLWIWIYRATLLSIVEKWNDDAAFSHGFLIPPIVLWLVWRKRAELRALAFKPSWLGAIAAAGCAVAWLVARGSGVLVVEQLAVVAMVPALVLAVLGWPTVRKLVFPLAFLLLMVPFGRGIVPGLMQATADIATVLLQWSGVPVLRTNMYLSIPGGNFEVARACSGLNYFTTALVLGLLYAYINFRGWPKRIAWSAAFVVLPILLNGVRVYITILVSHLTDMRFGPGAEHITFGRAFFVVVIIALFWIGRRWHDDPAAPAIVFAPEIPNQRPVTAGALTPVVMALVMMAVAPLLFAASEARARAVMTHVDTLVQWPAAAPGWQGPADGQGRWRPMYTGGISERLAVYETPDGTDLEVFVAVYGLGSNVGAEMISYNNLLFPEERGSLPQDEERIVVTPNGQSLRVREVVVGYGNSKRLVWQWFVVGERPVLSPFATKAYEALAFVTRSADSERIVTLATPLDDEAQARLQAFIDTYGRCAVVGFHGEDCGG